MMLISIVVFGGVMVLGMVFWAIAAEMSIGAGRSSQHRLQQQYRREDPRRAVGASPSKRWYFGDLSSSARRDPVDAAGSRSDAGWSDWDGSFDTEAGDGDMS
jgi:hypothetical protein